MDTLKLGDELVIMADCIGYDYNRDRVLLKKGMRVKLAAFARVLVQLGPKMVLINGMNPPGILSVDIEHLERPDN